MRKTVISTALPTLAGLALTGGGAALPAVAQAQPSGADRLVEEIVVTARRREESLQDAPIAISAYTGDSLAYRGITRLDQVEKFVPAKNMNIIIT